VIDLDALEALKDAGETLRRIDHMLRIPAAEYVPAISDVFEEIDKYFTRHGRRL